MTNCPTCKREIDPVRASVARVIGGRVIAFCSTACADGKAATASGSAIAARPMSKFATATLSSSSSGPIRSSRPLRGDNTEELGGDNLEIIDDATERHQKPTADELGDDGDEIDGIVTTQVTRASASSIPARAESSKPDDEDPEPSGPTKNKKKWRLFG